MDGGYEQLDRDGLLALVELLLQRVQVLEAENERLRQMVEQLVSDRKEPPSWAKSSRAKREGEQGKRRQRAPEHNHGRPRELAITTTMEHALDRCPHCGYRLAGHSLDYSRQVVELPEPVPVAVTEHRVFKRYCPHCKRYRSPKLDLQGVVLGQRRVGVRLMSLIAYLRQSLRLPVGQIVRYLGTMHGLWLSEGGIVALLHAAAEAAAPLAAELRQQARGSAVLHADETGWREGGRNGYIWGLSTEGPEAVRYYRFAFSRGTGTAKEVVGERVRGYLVTDFLGSYNDIAGGHQRCWPHLLRALHRLKEKRGQHPEVVPWAEAVGELYAKAKAWLPTEAARDKQERERQYVELTGQLRLLALGYAQTKEHPCQGLAKMLLRCAEELFPFVLVEGVPADNNLAERSLRPLVVIRKISGGTRSPKGSQTRMTLSTVFETWHARGLNTFAECLRLLSQPAATPS